MAEKISVLMDLATLGEFASMVVMDFADSKGIEVEDDDCELIANSALESLRFLNDRAEFARSVLNTVDDLPPLVNFDPAEDFPGEFIPE